MPDLTNIPLHVVERFWSRVDKSGDCWLWTAGLDPSGYGRLRVDGLPRLVHRVSYVIARGPIPTGLTVDHLCFVRTCVNPDHLEAVTSEVNYRRAVESGRLARNGDEHRRKTHCPREHPYDEVNTYITPRGGRSCRTCRRKRGRA